MFEAIKAICSSCDKFRGLCSLYIRPCSTKKLWQGELDPPEECPNKEAIENAEPLPKETPQ